MVSTTIGAAGGRLSAADGRLALTIPAGALASATVIGTADGTHSATAAVSARAHNPVHRELLVLVLAQQLRA